MFYLLLILFWPIPLTVTEITGASSCPSSSLPDVPAPSTRCPSLLCITSPWTVSSDEKSHQYNEIFTTTHEQFELLIEKVNKERNTILTQLQEAYFNFSVKKKMLNIENNLIIHINFYWFNILFKFQLQCWMIESNKIFLSNQKWPISPTARVCNYLVDRSTCVLLGFYLLTAVYFFNSLHYMKCIQLPNRWKVVTPFLIFLHQILLIYISTEKKIVKKISSLSINVLYSETCMMKNLQWDKNYVFQKF